MSDLLEAASAALGTPSDLVQRSAAARAQADGTSVDDVLAAWAGDAPPPAPAQKAEPEPAVSEPEPAATEAAPEPVVPEIGVIEAPRPAVPDTAAAFAEESLEVLEPVPMGVRIKTAVRIGAWTGAALGVVGFLVASAFWAGDATILPDGGPLVQVSPGGVTLGMALVSVVFGAIVAGMSRAATAWTNPAMELSGSKSGTAWLGAVLGLILGVMAGALLNGFGTPVEGSDPAVVQLPVLATLFVMIIGGAALGAVTALVPQFLGVPVAVDESDAEEVETVKRRLSGAMGIPIAGLLLLLLLVLPFAFTLIASNDLAPGVGGAVVAIITSAGILGFASLAGSKPDMRISFGDAMVAVIGIAALLVIIVSVLLAIGGGDNHEDGTAGGEATAIVQMI